jgi:hypothetical protein
MFLSHLKSSSKLLRSPPVVAERDRETEMDVRTGAKILVQEPKLENQLIVLRLLQEPTVMTDADRAGE